MIVEGIELYFVDYEYDQARLMIYAPLHGFLDLIEKVDLNHILNNCESQVRKNLIGAIRKKPVINIDNVAADYSRTVPALDLALTENCNLRCLYCHASAGDDKKTDQMSEKMITEILNAYFSFIKDKKAKQVQIGFSGGGEPAYDPALLEYAVVKAAEIAADHGAKCQFSMATNGYYGKAVRDLVMKSFKEVSLSFDGPEQIQNLHRPVKNGNGSFERVFETAKYFQEKKYRFAFRTTVSAYSLNYLKETIDFFADKFPGRSLKLEPLNPVGRAESGRTGGIKAPDKITFSRKLIEILDYAREKPLMILNSASTEFDKIRVAFCSNVGIPNWIVDVRGNIRACPRNNSSDLFLFGKFDQDLGRAVIFEEKVSGFKKMSALFYEECKDCFCKYHCAGDCAERRFSDRSDCNSIRTVGAHILSQKIYSGKTV